MSEHAALLKGTADSGINIMGCTCGWRCPQDAPDSDTAFTWHVAFSDSPGTLADAEDPIALAAAAQRVQQAELVTAAIAWAHADRIADDRSAELLTCQGEIHDLPSKGLELDPQRDALLAKFARAEAAFHRADQIAITCDEAFRQAARKLAEGSAP